MRGTLMDCRYNQKESCISFFIWQPPMEKIIATLVCRRVSFAQESVAICQKTWQQESESRTSMGSATCLKGLFLKEKINATHARNFQHHQTIACSAIEMRTDDCLLLFFFYIRSLFGCGFFIPFEKLRLFFPSGAAK